MRHWGKSWFAHQNIRAAAEFYEQCKRLDPVKAARALELSKTTTMDFWHAWHSDEASTPDKETP